MNAPDNEIGRCEAMASGRDPSYPGSRRFDSCHRPPAPDFVPASQSWRWNIDRDGDDLLVCFNEHDKGQSCEYVRFKPERNAGEKIALPMDLMRRVLDALECGLLWAEHSEAEGRMRRTTDEFRAWLIANESPA